MITNDLDAQTKTHKSILLQLLPSGLYDSAEETNIADDISGHAKVLAQADLDGQKLLETIPGVQPELIVEYEVDFGLPLKCTLSTSLPIEERVRIVKWAQTKLRGLEYYRELFSFYDIELIDYIKPKPFQCTQSCNLPVNTEQLRFKIKLIVSNPNSVDTQCIINSYFPAFLEVNVVEV
ncbi:hypothetical protein WCE14_00585 [Acinetobacter schindleri]|uniref:hypothetical protein n=1 Tax=Acinetobacter schindleri TaxID=108981 RepID=UPI0034D7173E